VKDASVLADGPSVGSGGAGGPGGSLAGGGAGGTLASGGAGGTLASDGGADARVDLPTNGDLADVGGEVADTPGERCDVPPVACLTNGVCGQPCCASEIPYGRHCNGAGGAAYFVCRAGVWGMLTEWDVAGCAPPFFGVDASQPRPDGAAPDSLISASDGPGVDACRPG
jgi:hypothetical protein